jgi:hypothetical protein
MKRIFLALPLSLILLGAGCQPTTRPAPPPVQVPTPAPPVVSVATYVDPHHRFTFQYPPDAKVITAQNQLGATGYLPVCDEQTSQACAFFSGDKFPGSNFDGAGVSVNVLPDAKTAAACRTGFNGAELIGNRDLGGVAFSAFSDGDAAMSHASVGNDYQTFFQGTCYQVTTRVFTTTFNVYPPGAIKEYTAAQDEQMKQVLDSIVASFRLTPASAGPVIQSLVPTNAAVGDVVTVHGFGFTADNDVLIGPGDIPHVPASADGTSLAFKIPSMMGPHCPSGKICPMYLINFAATSGPVQVSVENASGSSNAVTLTMIQK